MPGCVESEYVESEYVEAASGAETRVRTSTARADGAGRDDFAIRLFDRESELLQYFRLRYDVYSDVGYVRNPNRSKLDIDEYDVYAIPLGAIEISTGRVVATLRLITNDLQGAPM